MRRVVLFLAFLLPLVVLGNDPKVDSEIPQLDVRRICEVVASDTRDPILAIHTVITGEPGPGAIPKQATHSGPDGTWPVTVYARVDLVWVLTRPPTGMPMSYKLQKTRDTWKVITKGRMVE